MINKIFYLPGFKIRSVAFTPRSLEIKTMYMPSGGLPAGLHDPLCSQQSMAIGGTEHAYAIRQVGEIRELNGYIRKDIDLTN